MLALFYLNQGRLEESERNYGQALALYGILQNKGVPSRLVIFPDENHWILSPQNSIYWNWEVQAWLARYIGGKPMAKPEFAAE